MSVMFFIIGGPLMTMTSPVIAGVAASKTVVLKENCSERKGSSL